MCDSELKMAMAMVSPSLKKILNYPNRVVCVLTFDDRETEKTRFFFGFWVQSFIQTWLQGLPHTSGSLCSTEALLLVFIKLCFDGLFFICLLYVYINEKDWDMDLDLLFMCQLVEMVDLWFFYQNIGFWKWGLFDFVIGIIFIFQVLVFITAKINGFLIFGNGVFCFCRWYRIYQV